MHGVCHIEIPSKDMEKTGKFYADVFGWENQAYPEMDYMMFKPGDGVGGGYDNAGTPLETGGITLYIEVEDIDATLKKIDECGGKTIKPKYEIPNVGFIAFFADVDGNRMGLWSK
jgi:predicted enzyme related to lactoylglutathione lyase